MLAEVLLLNFLVMALIIATLFGIGCDDDEV
jgi:hypothetical protein